MIDKERIIIMTKLAIYDKNYGEGDKKVSGFFRHDYVYWKNFWVRLYALLGSAILVGLHIIERVIINQEDLFMIDYQKEGYKILMFVIRIMVVYTIIGSIKATREYSKVQRRIETHLKLTKRLDYLSANKRGMGDEIQP